MARSLTRLRDRRQVGDPVNHHSQAETLRALEALTFTMPRVFGGRHPVVHEISFDLGFGRPCQLLRGMLRRAREFGSFESNLTYTLLLVRFAAPYLPS